MSDDPMLDFDLSGDDSHKLEFTKLLSDKKNIDMMSSLEPHEVMPLTTAYTFAIKFKSPLMRDWIKQFLNYRVSEKREGRKEVISSYRLDREEQQRNSMQALGSILK